MSLNVPYDALSLQIALLGVGRKLEEYEQKNGEGSVQKKFEESKLTVPEGGAEFNKAAAAHHGISVEAYLNSPNYAVLKQDYGLSMMNKVMDMLKTEFGFSDKEAWAMVLHDQLERE